MSKVLLVIDLQTAMFDGNLMPPIHNASGLLKTATTMLTRARAAGIPVIYVQHDDDPGGPLEPHSAGWTIQAEIAPQPQDPVVRKSQPDAFQGTDLLHRLRNFGATALVIMGAQTEYCIDTNCRAAAALGYDVTLISDAHSTWDSTILTAEQIIAHHNAVLGSGFVRLHSAAEIDFRQ